MAADQMSWAGPHVIAPIRADEKTPNVIKTTSAMHHTPQQARIKEAFFNEKLSGPKPNILATVHDLAHWPRNPNLTDTMRPSDAEMPHFNVLPRPLQAS